MADAARAIQHMQQALELMNVKLTEVVADITGTTGQAIIEAGYRLLRSSTKGPTSNGPPTPCGWRSGGSQTPSPPSAPSTGG